MTLNDSANDLQFIKRCMSHIRRQTPLELRGAVNKQQKGGTETFLTLTCMQLQ
jgi:hypothetical protein